MWEAEEMVNVTHLCSWYVNQNKTRSQHCARFDITRSLYQNLNNLYSNRYLNSKFTITSIWFTFLQHIYKKPRLYDSDTLLSETNIRMEKLAKVEGNCPAFTYYVHSFIHSFTLFSVYPYTGENQGCGNCHSCSYKN